MRGRVEVVHLVTAGWGYRIHPKAKGAYAPTPTVSPRSADLL